MPEQPKSSFAVRMGTETPTTLKVRTGPTRYKGATHLVERTLSPPSTPLSPSIATPTDGRLRLASPKAIPSTNTRPLHTPPRLPSSITNPSSSSSSSYPTPFRPPRSGRLDHFDLSPVFLTPPASSPNRRSERTPTASGRAGLPLRYHNPFASPRRLDRNNLWPESPTLSVQRARKHSQPIAAPTPPLFNPGMHTMSCLPLPPFEGSAASPNRRDYLVHEPLRAGITVPSSHDVPMSFKPRAMTLDGTDRPTLPPVLGYAQQSQVGPIRTSPYRAFSAFRPGSEHRNNPYFISTPAHLPPVNIRAHASHSPSTRRKGVEAEPRSPHHAPWTPTSSLRSTFGGIHHDYFLGASHSLIHASPSTPTHLDQSPIEPCPVPADPIKEDASGYLGMTGSSYLPSSDVVSRNNALGLHMDHPPFRSELLQLDLGYASQRSFMLPHGSCAYGRSAAARNGPKTFTRSPASMSDMLPLTPSPPSSSDDVLPKLCLGHRHDLDARCSDLAPPLPALSSRRPNEEMGVSLIDEQAAEKGDSENLYKMPILRAMSPLADMSSDSDVEVAKETLASSSTFSSTQGSASQESAVLSKTKRENLPREGCSGEIFVAHKSALPLTRRKNGNHARGQHLFCKLESTTHQCFSVVDGKWACYRRNYLKVDVCFHFEDERGGRCDDVDGELLCQANSKEPVVIERMAVHMTAHVVAPDGSLQKGRQGLVPLIQFGPARERGPREVVQPIELRSGGAITRDATVNEQIAARSGNIAAFRRVQIRSATMNNGQRGSAGQQFYALKLTLLGFGKQGPMTASAGVELATLVSHPITVRGRSKVHYAPTPATGVNKRQAASALPFTGAAGTRRTAPDDNRGRTSRNTHAHQRVPDVSGKSSSRRSIRLLRPTGKPTPVVMDEAAEEASHVGAAPGPASRPANKVMDIRSVI